MMFHSYLRKKDNIIAVEQEKDAMEKDQLKNKKTLFIVSYRFINIQGKRQ